MVNMGISTDVPLRMANTGGSVLITQRTPREMSSLQDLRRFGRCVDTIVIASSLYWLGGSVKDLTPGYRTGRRAGHGKGAENRQGS